MPSPNGGTPPRLQDLAGDDRQRQLEPGRPVDSSSAGRRIR